MLTDPYHTVRIERADDLAAAVRDYLQAMSEMQGEARASVTHVTVTVPRLQFRMGRALVDYQDVPPPPSKEA